LEAGEPYPRAYCRWREAEARLSRRDGRARAEACLQEALQVCAELDAAPLRASIEQLAQRGRIVLRDLDGEQVTAASSLGRDLGLTPREVEVLGLLARGQTDREIAELLYISRKTASVHVSNLLRKLEVGSRIEAGRIGQVHGAGG
jgi:DNA-binding NarL/FixJ family response regulator